MSRRQIWLFIFNLIFLQIEIQLEWIKILSLCQTLCALTLNCLQLIISSEKIFFIITLKKIIGLFLISITFWIFNQSDTFLTILRNLIFFFHIILTYIQIERSEVLFIFVLDPGAELDVQTCFFLLFANEDILRFWLF